MSRLSSSDQARIALEWRKLEQRAALIRGRVEALPGAYQAGPMRAAENKIGLRKMDQAREALDLIDEKLAEHVQALEAKRIADASAEQAQLLAERGVETFDDGPVKHRDGWHWLTTRKPPRLTYDEIDAGNDYAKLYSLAMRDDLSISSNDNARVQNENAGDRTDNGMANRWRLEVVQRHISVATGSTRLVALLDAVCGRGDTLRSLADNDDRKALGLEVELKVALQMAHVGLKIMRVRDQERAA